MDDGTKVILDKLAALDGRFDRAEERWDREALRVEQVHGMVQKLDAKMEERFQTVGERFQTVEERFGGRLEATRKELADLIRTNHAEQMRQFQSVITEAERIGAATA